MDADIRNEAPNDIPGLLKSYPRIKRILLNGRKAESSFHRYFPKIDIDTVSVPSTSPAYAKKTLFEKANDWNPHLCFADDMGSSGRKQTPVPLGVPAPLGVHVPLGVYRHYKGYKYELVGFAIHSETLEDMVIYKALYGERHTWVRPLSMWENLIEVDGKSVKRFECIDIKREPDRLQELNEAHRALSSTMQKCE